MSRNQARCLSLSFLKATNEYGTSLPSVGAASFFFSRAHLISPWDNELLMWIYFYLSFSMSRMLISINWEVQEHFITLINQIALSWTGWMILRSTLQLRELWRLLESILMSRSPFVTSLLEKVFLFLFIVFIRKFCHPSSQELICSVSMSYDRKVEKAVIFYFIH